MTNEIDFNALEAEFMLDLYHSRTTRMASRAQDTVRRRLRKLGLVYFERKKWHLTPLGHGYADTLDDLHNSYL